MHLSISLEIQYYATTFVLCLCTLKKTKRKHNTDAYFVKVLEHLFFPNLPVYAVEKLVLV